MCRRSVARGLHVPHPTAALDDPRARSGFVLGGEWQGLSPERNVASSKICSTTSIATVAGHASRKDAHTGGESGERSAATTPSSPAGMRWDRSRSSQRPPRTFSGPSNRYSSPPALPGQCPPPESTPRISPTRPSYGLDAARLHRAVRRRDGHLAVGRLLTGQRGGAGSSQAL